MLFVILLLLLLCRRIRRLRCFCRRRRRRRGRRRRILLYHILNETKTASMGILAPKIPGREGSAGAPKGLQFLMILDS